MTFDPVMGHLVGDFLCQNHWQATKKKAPTTEGRLACASHCLIWTTSVMLFSGWGESPYAALIACILYLTHYIQDRTYIIQAWMRLNGQADFIEPPFGPWSVIIVDNVWHLLTLWLISRFLV